MVVEKNYSIFLVPKGNFSSCSSRYGHFPASDSFPELLAGKDHTDNEGIALGSESSVL